MPKWMMALLAASVAMVVSDMAWSQSDTAWSQSQIAQRNHLRLAQRSHQRPTPAEPTMQPKEEAHAPEPTSTLGKDLASCEGTAVKDTFVLPGSKSEITLDKCYRGRAHLVCVFTALGTEAAALTASYTKIIKAGYPSIANVDDICRIDRDTLAADIAGAEDFHKRFTALKSQYENAAKCAATVKAAFKDVSLTDMAQPPEILKSMTNSIDGDVTRVSESQKQISDLSIQMEAAKKAMRTLDKLHKTMCNQFFNVKSSESQ
jgi:hypothetical protein